MPGRLHLGEPEPLRGAFGGLKSSGGIRCGVITSRQRRRIRQHLAGVRSQAIHRRPPFFKGLERFLQRGRALGARGAEFILYQVVTKSRSVLAQLSDKGVNR